MKDNPWKRVYGRVIKGPKYTRFRLETVLSNGCTFYVTKVRTNEHLKRYPSVYGRTLDGMIEELTKRLEQRAL